MANEKETAFENKNVVVEKKEGSVLVKVNTRIYPLAVIYQAADVLIDKNYVFLDGDPEKEVMVTIKPKSNDTDLEEVAGEFADELLNYAAYFVRSTLNRDLRQVILKRAFFTVLGEAAMSKDFEEKLAEKETVCVGIKVPVYEGDRKVPVGEGKVPEPGLQEMGFNANGSPAGENCQSEEFDVKDVLKPWDEQSGRLESGPVDEQSLKKQKPRA